MANGNMHEIVALSMKNILKNMYEIDWNSGFTHEKMLKNMYEIDWNSGFTH